MFAVYNESKHQEDMENDQEQTIILKVRDGEHDQYRLLVERYHRGLIQHLYNLLHDEQTAEDIAQEAFIRAYDKIALYNPTYAFSTWLYRIADNIAFRHLKQQKSFTDIDDIEESTPDDKPSLADTVERLFTQEAVQQAVKALPLAYQQVVALYYWDNFSYEEIADTIDRPIGTVRTWLFRAKEQLRKELYGQV
jgi:RNA polymerase sigma-70 factor (ECF subfamily)